MGSKERSGVGSFSRATESAVKMGLFCYGGISQEAALVHTGSCQGASPACVRTAAGEVVNSSFHMQLGKLERKDMCLHTPMGTEVSLREIKHASIG